jgi:L,D-transpeptidase YbiS
MKYYSHLKIQAAKQFEKIVATLRSSMHVFIDVFVSFIKEHYKALTVITLMLLVPLLVRGLIWLLMASPESNYQADEAELQSVRKSLTKEIKRLDRKLDSKMPKTYFLVINSASNEFALYKGSELIKKDKCSTGSYVLLKNGDDQEWLFKTPKGEFKIQGKITSPIWRKPDWAFVEEGLPVPSATHHTRYEHGVLGDYALSLGHGYLIHGTLYQRFLGLPVTHGCIRLNDDNLELVYNALQVGSKVYIY